MGAEQARQCANRAPIAQMLAGAVIGRRVGLEPNVPAKVEVVA
jgi:hypothetical protein